MLADFELQEIDRLNRAVELERERMRTLIELLHLAGVDVKPGQMIGYSGRTGNAEAEHLHLSVYEMIGDAWYLVDPMKFLYGQVGK